MKTEYFGGFRLVENPHLVVCHQRRKHKKKRINKKWMKRYGMVEEPLKDFYMADNMIIAHPAVIAKIKAALDCMKGE